MSQEAEWFLERNGKQEGPFTAAQVVELHQKGELKKSDRVTAEWLFGEWIELEELVAGYQASRLDIPVGSDPTSLGHAHKENAGTSVSEPALDIGGGATKASATPIQAPAPVVKAAAPKVEPSLHTSHETPAPVEPAKRRTTPAAPVLSANSPTPKQVIDPAIPLFELLQQAKERRAKRSTLFDVTAPAPETDGPSALAQLKPWIGIILFLVGAAYAVSYFRNTDFSSSKTPPPPLPHEEEASQPTGQTFQSMQPAARAQPAAPAYIPPPRPFFQSQSGSNEDREREQAERERREREEQDTRDLHVVAEPGMDQPAPGPAEVPLSPEEARSELEATPPQPADQREIPPPSLDGATPADGSAQPYTQ